MLQTERKYGARERERKGKTSRIDRRKEMEKIRKARRRGNRENKVQGKMG